MIKKRLVYITTTLFLAMLLFVAADAPRLYDVQAEAITNYGEVETLNAGTTSVSIAGVGTTNFTAVNVASYGHARIEVTQDISGTGDITYKLQLASKTVRGLCTSVTNWADATEQVYVANPATAASSRISYTTQTTTTGPLTITYNYETVAATAASVTVVEQESTVTVSNDATEARTFALQGAYCARIQASSTATATFTPTVYLTPMDYYE